MIDLSLLTIWIICQPVGYLLYWVLAWF